MKILDEAAIRAAIRESEALDAAEAAFRALGAGAVNLPPPMGSKSLTRMGRSTLSRPT